MSVIRWTPCMDSRLAAGYAAGESVSALGRALHVSGRAVVRRLRHLGVYVEPPGGESGRGYGLCVPCPGGSPGCTGRMHKGSALCFRCRGESRGARSDEDTPPEVVARIALCRERAARGEPLSAGLPALWGDLE